VKVDCAACHHVAPRSRRSSSLGLASALRRKCSTSDGEGGAGDVGRKRARGRLDHVAAGRRVGRPPVRPVGCFWLPGTRRADWVPYPGRGTSLGGSKARGRAVRSGTGQGAGQRKRADEGSHSGSDFSGGYSGHFSGVSREFLTRPSTPPNSHAALCKPLKSNGPGSRIRAFRPLPHPRGRGISSKPLSDRGFLPPRDPREPPGPITPHGGRSPRGGHRPPPPRAMPKRLADWVGGLVDG
jgi:hypothetical protein